MSLEGSSTGGERSGLEGILPWILPIHLHSSKGGMHHLRPNPGQSWPDQLFGGHGVHARHRDHDSWGAANQLSWLENMWLWITFLGNSKSLFLFSIPWPPIPLSRWASWWDGSASSPNDSTSSLSGFFLETGPFGGSMSLGTTAIHLLPSSYETGPGSPSHTVPVGTVLWPITMAVSSQLATWIHSRWVRVIPSLAYWSSLLAIGLSWVFLLAYFPHQNLTGLITGAVLGRLMPPGCP